MFRTFLVDMMDFRSMILWMGFDEAKMWLTGRLQSWFYDQIISHLIDLLDLCDVSDRIPESSRVGM